MGKNCGEGEAAKVRGKAGERDVIEVEEGLQEQRVLKRVKVRKVK